MVFLTFDKTNRYWEMEMGEVGRGRPNFTSHNGVFQFTKDPFGLRNSSRVFQGTMDVILFSF